MKTIQKRGAQRELGIRTHQAVMVASKPKRSEDVPRGVRARVQEIITKPWILFETCFLELEKTSKKKSRRKQAQHNSLKKA